MSKYKKPAGHKKNCACIFCKRARTGSASGRKKATKHAGGAKKKTTKKRKTKRRGVAAAAVRDARPGTRIGLPSYAEHFVDGLRDGAHDVQKEKPLRKTAGRKDDYSKGYRVGVSQARAAKRAARKSSRRRK